MILVNEKKKKRAVEIVEILGRNTKNETEKNLKDTYAPLIAEDKVAEKDVLEYVYVKLGGLTRTEAEQKKAKEVEKEAKKKYKQDKKKDDED